MRKIISVVLSFGLLFQQSGLLYAAGEINLANSLSQAKSAIVQPDVFQPTRLRYISYDAASNDFKLLLDKGDLLKGSPGVHQATKSPEEISPEKDELFKYFLIGLSLPNDTFWVNLRPDAPENIIDPILEKTEIGKIFLEADLQLKKDTSSLTSPQNPEGKAYWDKLYKKAGELFPAENITIPTITRPWIVPNEVIVRETEDSAYIYKATLKVMLEADYLSSFQPSAVSFQQYGFSDSRLKELNEYSSQIIRETIIPKLTREVNSSKRYARLRQVYYSLVLARWFKQKYSSLGSIRAPEHQSTGASANSYISLIDSGNLANLASQEPCDKQTYFQAYQKSFKDGEYNLKETVATPYGQNIRSYISGGISVGSPIIGGNLKMEKGNMEVTAALTGGFSASPLTEEHKDLIRSIETLLKTPGINFDKNKIMNSPFDRVYEYIMSNKTGEIEKKFFMSEDELTNFDKELRDLLRQICRVGIEYLLQNAVKGYVPKDINRNIVNDEIDEVASKLEGIFLREKNLGWKVYATACESIRNAWWMAAAGSPVTATDEEMKYIAEAQAKLAGGDNKKAEATLDELIEAAEDAGGYAMAERLKEIKSRWSVYAGSPLEVKQVVKALKEIQSGLKGINTAVSDLSKNGYTYDKNFQNISNPLGQVISFLQKKINYLGQIRTERISIEDISYFGKLKNDLGGIQSAINKFVEINSAENNSRNINDSIKNKFKNLSEGIVKVLKQAEGLDKELQTAAGSPLGVKLDVSDINGRKLRYVAYWKLSDTEKEGFWKAFKKLPQSSVENYLSAYLRYAVAVDSEGSIVSIVGWVNYDPDTRSIKNTAVLREINQKDKLYKELRKKCEEELEKGEDFWKEKSVDSPVVGEPLPGYDNKEIGLYLSLPDLEGKQWKKLLDLVKAKVFPVLAVKKSEILGIGANGGEILNSLMEEGFLREIRSADGFLRVNEKKMYIGMLRNIIKSNEDFKKVWRILKSSVNGVKAIPILEISHLREMRFAVNINKKGEWKLLGLLQFGNDNNVEDIMADTIEIMSALNKAWKKELGVSSAVVSRQVPKKLDKRGGIDLTDRALQIKLERVGSFASSALVLPQVKNVEGLDLDKEFEQIEALASSGINPNSHRLLELFTVCHYRGEFSQRLPQVISCLKASSAVQEAQAIDSDEDFRLALMMPELLS